MIKKYGIPQEGLKLIACLTMLIDHIGSFFFPSATWLRLIGRISFPIFAFLLAEGVYYTSSMAKYGLRMFLVALITELPYDLLFRGEFTWQKNSIMVTLLLGFLMGWVMKYLPLWAKAFAVIPFAFLGQHCNGSYGMNGVLMIAIFLLTQEFPHILRFLVRALLFALLTLRMSGYPTRLTIQVVALAAIVPLALYSGKKVGLSPVLKWGFTLFYPVHLVILLIIRSI